MVSKKILRIPKIIAVDSVSVGYWKYRGEGEPLKSYIGSTNQTDTNSLMDDTILASVSHLAKSTSRYSVTKKSTSTEGV